MLRTALLALVLFAGLYGQSAARAEGRLPERVSFPGPDGQELVGYLFHLATAGHHPVVVMMHGRAGPYSSLANGLYDASTLSKRHVFWGETWASQGYLALLVDSFGPRGYPAGFPAHSYADRPEAVSEVDVRPRDAYAALAYLRTRPDADGARIALQGWSNGGSATLATMASTTLERQHLGIRDGFLGGVALYPACGLHDAFASGYVPYAPVRVFSGSADEEVSAAHCSRFVEASRAAGGDIDIAVYPGATHDFDDPGQKRQSVEANAAARADAVPRVLAFMHRLLEHRPAAIR